MRNDRQLFKPEEGDGKEPHPVVRRWHGAQFDGDPHKYCAYNENRQHLLSIDVEGADFSQLILANRLAALAPDSGLALWIAPFRGLSPGIIRYPVDLLYLDAEHLVLDTVESFPLAQVDASSQPAATVLVLPAQSIARSGTGRGDRLILCRPEELKRHLASQQEAMRSSSEPAIENPDHEAPSAAGLPTPDAQAGPPVRQNVKQPKSWLRRLFSAEPDEPRKAPREALPWVVAFFFTGATPVPHPVRNMSATGLYIYTEERWSKGTMLRITLTDRREPSAERSITVNAQVARWGNDGVGLQFVYADRKRGPGSYIEDGFGAVNRGHVEQFMERIKTGI